MVRMQLIMLLLEIISKILMLVETVKLTVVDRMGKDTSSCTLEEGGFGAG